MAIIDIHAHIFPDKLATKAAISIGNFYDLPMNFDGTVSTLLDLNRSNGITRAVVHSVATVPQQVQSINDFIALSVQQHPEELIGFATIHPGYAGIEKEIDRVADLGLMGIKIHPDFQKFLLDSPEAFPIYEAIEGRMPILVHTGDFRYEYSKARRMVAVLDRFPKLQVICAHFGGWSEWEESAELLAGRNVYVDTSSSLYALTGEQAGRLIGLLGADNVLFGTDYPMGGPAEELEYFSKIPLSEEDRQKILHGNTEKLLGLNI